MCSKISWCTRLQVGDHYHQKRLDTAPQVSAWSMGFFVSLTFKMTSFGGLRLKGFFCMFVSYRMEASARVPAHLTDPAVPAGF